MSDLVPWDLWPQILEHLPAQSLCRFRCVCSAWNSLITSSDFIARHLSATAANPSRRRILVNAGHFIGSYSLFPFEDLSRTAFNFPHDLRFPFQAVNTGTRNQLDFSIIGVVSGVIGLSYGTRRLILWNASVRRYLELPRYSLHHYWTFALGFDASTNDFKVVRMCQACPECRSPVTGSRIGHVFSARSGVWNAVKINAIGRFDWMNGGQYVLFFNGKIHWCSSNGRYNGLLVFNCRTDEFKSLDLPRCFEVGDEACVLVHLMEFRGMLAILDFRFDSSTFTSKTCNIWAMRDYGVVDSWSNLFAIELERGVERILMAREEDGDEIVMFSHGELSYYNSKTGESKGLGIEATNGANLRVVTFEPSLMLLDVGSSSSYEAEDMIIM